MRLFPDFFKQNYTAMQLQAGESMMPLKIESIGDNEISIAHYYRQNGDSMSDPEMTFRIDHENGTLEPLTGLSRTGEMDSKTAQGFKPIYKPMVS